MTHSPLYQFLDPRYVPSNDEIPTIEAEIKQHEAEAAAMQEKLDALLARQEEINNQIKVKQADIPTVPKVLTDILSKIFTVYVRDFGGSPYDVVEVCRMWRSAALYHTPGIWGRILLIVPQVILQSSWDDGFFVCSSPDALAKALERYKDKNISLRLTSATPSENINLSDLLPYRRIFSDSTQCWESLDIDLPTIPNDPNNNTDAVTAATLIANLMSSASSLRHLKLTNIDLKGVTWTASPVLETLTLTRCQLDLSKGDYPALVELHFDSTSTPSTLTRIPNLRLLRYRGPWLAPLTQITAPSLQTLDLASFDDKAWLDGGCVSRFNPRVLLLRAGGWDRAVFKAFLGWMNNIESLYVEATMFLTAMDILEELEHVEMVSLQGADEGDAGAELQRPVTCPKLSSLDITLKEEVCGDCISQLRSLSNAVLKKYTRLPLLRLKFSDGKIEETCSRDH